VTLSNLGHTGHQLDLTIPSLAGSIISKYPVATNALGQQAPLGSTEKAQEALGHLRSNEKHWLPKAYNDHPNGFISHSVFPQPT